MSEGDVDNVVKPCSKEHSQDPPVLHNLQMCGRGGVAGSGAKRLLQDYLLPSALKNDKTSKVDSPKKVSRLM